MGKSGGRPKKETIGFEKKETIGFEKKETKTKPNVNDNVNDNVNVNVNDNENENVVFRYFVEKYKKVRTSNLQDKMNFLREIKQDDKYKELTEADEYELTDYILKDMG